MFIWRKAGLARWVTRLAEPTFLFLIQTVRRVLWGNVGSPRIVRFGDRPRYRAKFSPYKRDIRSGVWLYSVWVALIPDNFDSLLLSDLSKTCHFQVRSGTSLALIPREKMTSSLLVHVAWVNRDLKIPRYRCTGTGSVPLHVKCSCAWLFRLRYPKNKHAKLTLYMHVA